MIVCIIEYRPKSGPPDVSKTLLAKMNAQVHSSTLESFHTQICSAELLSRAAINLLNQTKLYKNILHTLLTGFHQS